MAQAVSGSIPSREGGHLFGPASDVLLLGGASVLAFLVLQVVAVEGEGLSMLAWVMLALANVVNHPHFAHSYQLFYGAWPQLRRGEFPKTLARGWWLSGVVVPTLMALFLGAAAYRWSLGDKFWMGLAVNLMGALVGWHYVKQGFGMAMTDAAFKRCFWSASARRALLWNAYACWAYAWAVVNTSSAGSYFWGVFNVRAAVPESMLLAVGLLAAASSAWVGLTVYGAVSAWRRAGVTWSGMPLNGVLAYVITLYLWTAFAGINPAYALVIPFFHSLQYLTVVWRYKLNEARTAGGIDATGRAALWRFAARGFVLGALGFWLLPGLLERWQTGGWPTLTGGTSLAIAVAWLFINVHHYFIDTVLWRRENPNVSRHLFK